MKLITSEETGKTLYAIAACVRLPNGTVKPIQSHCHAMNAQDARFQFVSSLPIRQRYSVEIMGIGPVIGVWGEETKDKKIIVSV